MLNIIGANANNGVKYLPWTPIILLNSFVYDKYNVVVVENNINNPIINNPALPLFLIFFSWGYSKQNNINIIKANIIVVLWQYPRLLKKKMSFNE